MHRRDGLHAALGARRGEHAGRVGSGDDHATARDSLPPRARRPEITGGGDDLHTGAPFANV